MAWRRNLSEAPERCVVVLSMGSDPRSGQSYDVVCEARRIDGVWSGNAMRDIGARIRGWVDLPPWFEGPGEA